MLFCQFFNIESRLFIPTILWIGLMLIGSFNRVLAQNIFPNPDFEAFDLCPDGFGQVARLQDWDKQGGSPDYYNCGYYGNQVNGKPAAGTGVIGFWGGAQHPACGSTGYAEYVSASLLETLVSGTQYALSFDSQINGISGISGPPSSCMDIGFYFYKSSTTTIPDQFCCYNFKPQVVIPADEIKLDQFKTFQYSFIASDEFDKVVIGPFCNDNTSSSACDNYFAQRMYFNLDALQLSENPVLDGSSKGEEDIYSFEPSDALKPSPKVLYKSGQWEINLPENGILTISRLDAIGRLLKRSQKFFLAGKHQPAVEPLKTGHILVFQFYDEEGNTWRKVVR